MKKLMMLLCLLLCLGMLAQPVLASQTQKQEPEEPAVETTAETTEATEATEQPVPQRDPNQCGENAWWSISGGTLTISGSGAMDDFSGGAPWDDSRDSITALVIDGGISYIGASSFDNFDCLTSVSFGGSLYEIGTGAFRSCDGLTEITLPASFRVFGEESFYSCAMLRKIHFGGSMPKFKLNCLWDTYADLIFPAKNPWPLEHIRQLEEAFQGRIEFLSSDGSDPYVPEGETEPTEQTTAPTEETTVPTTVPVTEPVTEATQPSLPTEAATEQTVPTETAMPEATEPTEEKPQQEKGGGIGFAIVMAVLSLLALAVLLIGKLRPKGKYSK